MAGFFDVVKSKAQSAVDKGKELAEITKLNMDSSAAEDIIRNAKAEIGAFVLEKGLLTDCPEIAELLQKIAEAQDRIAANNEKIAGLKQVGKCPQCGAEMPEGAAFCGKCGYKKPAAEEPAGTAESVPGAKFCSSCGSRNAADQMYCSKCGTKLA